MATKAELIKRHPALNYAGAANLTALHKASEVLDDLKAKRGKSLSHVWGYDPNVSNTEHHSGRAFDFMVFKDKAAGGHIANYLIQHKQRLGLIHVIWYQRIYRGPYSTSKNPKGVWQVMADRGNDTQNHKDHPHAWFADIPYVPLTPPTALSSFLVRGSTGPEVALLQRMLNGMDKAGLSVDSSFGPAVEKAVKSAQSKRGLTADGKVGPATRSRLNADWKAYNTPTRLTSQLNRGASGPEVELLQKMLNKIIGAGLSVDGSFGPAVEAAVKRYQTSRSLEVDGKVGPATRAALNAEWSAPATTTTTTTRAATTTTTTLILPTTTTTTTEQIPVPGWDVVLAEAEHLASKASDLRDMIRSIDHKEKS